ncbi:MAG: polyprenol monophosphomannose synthase [Planctomycetota bacterium]
MTQHPATLQQSGVLDHAVEVAAPARIAVSVVVPTFREADGVTALLDRVDGVRQSHDIALELILMDDPSGDGITEHVAESGHDWARVVSRTGPRGLSAAVLDGFGEAIGDTIVVMDADLSHPPESIPDMLTKLDLGAQMVVGSRYVQGGSTDDGWGFFRWLNSAVATVLARPLTKLRDPMSGFFAVRRADVVSGHGYDPIGYKIALEVIVKCAFKRVEEVPIRFGLRHAGESKLTLVEQFKYIEHLRRLYAFRFFGVGRSS